MLVKIRVYYHKENENLQKLIDELKQEKATVKKETSFDIDLELNIDSFDKVICILNKYSKIDISLYIHDADKVSVSISHHGPCSLGGQVE